MVEPCWGVEGPCKGQGHLGRMEAKQPTPKDQPGMGAMGISHPTQLMSLVGSQHPQAAQPCATPGTGIPKSPCEGGPAPLPHHPSMTLMPEHCSPLGAPGPSLSPHSIKYSLPLLLNNRSTCCQEGHSSSVFAEAHTQAIRREAGAGRPAGRHSRISVLRPFLDVQASSTGRAL